MICNFNSHDSWIFFGTIALLELCPKDLQVLLYNNFKTRHSIHRPLRQ